VPVVYVWLDKQAKRVAGLAKRAQAVSDQPSAAGQKI
jgi:hypothetical protein